MDTQRAIEDLYEVQRTLARTTRANCFRWVSVTATGAIGMVAAVVDVLWWKSIEAGSESFAKYWFTIASVNCAIVGIELAIRYWRTDSWLFRGQTRTTLGQFAPCVVIGVFATIALLRASPNTTTLLPGLWCLFVSLGIFATLDGMRDSLRYPAIFYGLAGCWLWWNHDWLAPFASWSMGAAYGIGQTWIGFLLWHQQNHE